MNQKLLSQYIPIADFIAKMNGPNCEAVIHDTTDLQNSIVYITSPSITGREVGGTITDYALSLLRNRRHESTNFVVNYLGKSNKKQILRSSTYFIKHKDELVGLLCVNVDVTELVEAKALIDSAMLVNPDHFYGNIHQEHFDLSIDGLVQEVITTYTGGRPVSTLLPDEKRELTHRLEEKGVFLVKGTISLVAQQMGMSEQTIYRYLRDKADKASKKLKQR